MSFPSSPDRFNNAECPVCATELETEISVPHNGNTGTTFAESKAAKLIKSCKWWGFFNSTIPLLELSSERENCGPFTRALHVYENANAICDYKIELMQYTRRNGRLYQVYSDINYSGTVTRTCCQVLKWRQHSMVALLQDKVSRKIRCRGGWLRRYTSAASADSRLAELWMGFPLCFLVFSQFSLLNMFCRQGG